MIHKILVTSNGSSVSQRTVQNAIDLARATGASIVGFRATEPFPLRLYGDLMWGGVEWMQQHDEEERELSQRLLAPLEQAADDAGVGYTAQTVSSSSPAEAIVAAAEREGCDLICMPSHERHHLLGTGLDAATTKVLARSKIPVLVCH